MNRVNYYLINMLLLVLLICSCSDLDKEERIGDVDLTFMLDIPVATEVTRAYDDNSIRNLDLLVFNASSQFVERIRVNAISGSGATKTFSARLTASTSQRTIHIIANARDESNNDIISFSHITTSTSLAAAITGLTSGILSAGQSPELPLVMWGQTALASVNSSTTIGAAIPMLRMAASMYMTCDAPTTANGLDKFTLKGFSVVNASNKGSVAPAAYTSNAAIPSTPNLPSGVGQVNYALNASNTWALASSGTTSELYLYDKTNSGNQTTDLKIIIHGVWNNIEGYYPVWMSDGTANKVNVVRNHRYCVTVKGVYGTGYATLAEAISAVPSSSLVLTDTSDDMTDIITDGQYKLGVSSNKVTISGSGAKTIATVMKTNGSYTLKGESGDAWITGINVTTLSSERWTLSATLGATGSARTGTITVRAGNLTRTIQVTQNP